MLLAGDIGGTKTNLAIYSLEQGPRLPLVEATFPSDDYPSLQAIAQEFLSRVDYDVTFGCFGVAGPVMNGHVKTTNLPWEMDEAELSEALSLERVHLLNDLESVANAIPQLEPGDVATINPGAPQPGGSIAVIAPGTGLGEAFLTWDGERYRAYPSEGGHTDFAPANDMQMELLRFLMGRYRHVSYEWVCSGMGIPNIYAFFKEKGHADEPAWLTEELAAADDKTPVIVNNAIIRPEESPLCRLTLDMFVAVLGAEAGNLALKVLATGGVYLGGGIPPRILSQLHDGGFMESFLRKGRFDSLLAQMPVRVILNAKSGLMGAAAYGLEMERGNL